LSRTKKGSERYEEILGQLVAARSGRTEKLSGTNEELGQIIRNFMQWQTGFLRDSGVLGGNPLSTHTLELLTREQIAVMKDAFTRPRSGQRGLDEAVMGF
jgi:hypothetical protein